MSAGTAESWRWLASTRELQQTAFGVDLTSPPSSEKLADDVVHQGFALIMELAEAFGEFQWKDWAANRGDHDRDAFVEELVDVGHFLANLLIHFNVTDDEWEKLYQAKQERNRQRQAAGYDARASKCPGCKRELDKPGAIVRQLVFSCTPDSRKNVAMILCANCRAILGTQEPGASVWWNDGIDVPGVAFDSDEELFGA